MSRFFMVQCVSLRSSQQRAQKLHGYRQREAAIQRMLGPRTLMGEDAKEADSERQ